MSDTVIQLILMIALLAVGFLFIRKKSPNPLQKRAASSAFGVLVILVVLYFVLVVTQQPWSLMVVLAIVAVVVPSGTYLLLLRKGLFADTERDKKKTTNKQQKEKRSRAAQASSPYVEIPRGAKRAEAAATASRQEPTVASVGKNHAPKQKPAAATVKSTVSEQTTSPSLGEKEGRVIFEQREEERRAGNQARAKVQAESRAKAHAKTRTETQVPAQVRRASVPTQETRTNRPWEKAASFDRLSVMSDHRPERPASQVPSQKTAPIPPVVPHKAIPLRPASAEAGRPLRKPEQPRTMPQAAPTMPLTPRPERQAPAARQAPVQHEAPVPFEKQRPVEPSRREPFVPQPPVAKPAPARPAVEPSRPVAGKTAQRPIEQPAAKVAPAAMPVAERPQPHEAERSRFEKCVANAGALREKGLFAAAGALYEKAAASSGDDKQERKMLFSALSCYLKDKDYVSTSRLAESLSKKTDSMSNLELVKLEAVLSEIGERMAP